MIHSPAELERRFRILSACAQKMKYLRLEMTGQNCRNACSLISKLLLLFFCSMLLGILFIVLLIPAYPLYNEKYNHGLEFRNQCIVEECGENTGDIHLCLENVEICINNKKDQWEQDHYISGYGIKIRNMLNLKQMYNKDGNETSGDMKILYWILIGLLVSVLISFLIMWKLTPRRVAPAPVNMVVVNPVVPNNTVVNTAEVTREDSI